MRMFLPIALAAFVPVAAAVAATASNRPTVIFFGGYSSTSTDMSEWLSAAQASAYGKDFTFEAVPYPAGVGPVEADAERADAGVIAATVREIDGAPDRPFIVVGHSSAASVAARVVERARPRKNIRLIILDDGVDDGFRPPRGFDAKTQVECWSAADGALVSFNRAATMAFCANYHELQVNGCKTDVCLHFAVVNLNAAATLNDDIAFSVLPNGNTGGYKDLRVNLSWLNSTVGF